VDFREFDTLMTRLEDWHADSVQAQDYAGSSGSNEHGHAVLRVQPYPGPAWRRLWAEAERVGDIVKQAHILHQLENELYAIDHGAYLASPGASGLYPGTKAWDRAVATSEGSLREVARRFGTSHTTVRSIRLEYARAQA